MYSRPDKPMTEYPLARPEDFPPVPPAGAEREPTAPARPSAASPKRADAAALHFLDPAAVTITHTLRFPFLWDGREVRTVTIRRLAVAEVGGIVERLRSGDGDPVEFYAAMCDLPASVLLGMIDDDGMEVMAAADPFLPRAARELFSLLEGLNGGPTPSPAQPAATSL